MEKLIRELNYLANYFMLNEKMKEDFYFYDTSENDNGNYKIIGDFGSYQYDQKLSKIHIYGEIKRVPLLNYPKSVLSIEDSMNKIYFHEYKDSDEYIKVSISFYLCRRKESK